MLVFCSETSECWRAPQRCQNSFRLRLNGIVLRGSTLPLTSAPRTIPHHVIIFSRNFDERRVLKTLIATDLRDWIWDLGGICGLCYPFDRATAYPSQDINREASDQNPYDASPSVPSPRILLLVQVFEGGRFQQSRTLTGFIRRLKV